MERGGEGVVRVEHVRVDHPLAAGFQHGHQPGLRRDHRRVADLHTLGRAVQTFCCFVFGMFETTATSATLAQLFGPVMRVLRTFGVGDDRGRGGVGNDGLDGLL